MTITALVVRKIGPDSYVVEMSHELGSITAQVSLEQVNDDREYGEAERQTLACLRARELALLFAKAAELNSSNRREN